MGVLFLILVVLGIFVLLKLLTPPARDNRSQCLECGQRLDRIAGRLPRVCPRCGSQCVEYQVVVDPSVAPVERFSLTPFLWLGALAILMMVIVIWTHLAVRS